jgi:hypothetical protein
MSISLLELWLPILLASLFCWITSALFHMLIKHHNADYKKIDSEDKVADVLREANLAPGLYHLPYCADMKEMANEDMQKKFENGPIAMISVFENGMPAMGKLLIQQFLFFLVACILVAYVASFSLIPSAADMSVFRLVLVVSFLTFGWGLVPYSIWYGHPWSNCIRYLIDAIIYGLVTAVTFVWLWPQII